MRETGIFVALVLLANTCAFLAGLTRGRLHPGREWMRDPQADCRAYLRECPEFHFCPRCQQHWLRATEVACAP